LLSRSGKRPDTDLPSVRCTGLPPKLKPVSVRAGVAAGHPSTARAGADILSAGGSAADAAVAMVLVSCAAETIFTGLAGGGFATYYDAATRQTSCVDFFVAVPGLDGSRPGPGVPIEVFFVGQRMPYEIGPPTVAVPGVPAGTWHIWQRWGRLDWADIVAPGRAASFGTPFPATHAALLPSVAPAMCVSDGNQVFRRSDGTFLQAGDPLMHPDHHHAYEVLAEDPASFYTGDYADALVSAVADGSALRRADLEAYRVVEATPRTVSFHGFSVHARGDDLDDVLGTLSRAAHGVNADPNVAPEAALALVDALRGEDRRAETTNVVAVDGDGNACAITTSLGLGSGVWVPGYGVHLNSMLGEGELIREVLEPGVRMGSMMSPLVAVDHEDQLVLAAGAAGGSRIRPALVQSVLRMLTGATPQDAIDAPRLNALPGMVRLEPGFSDEVIAQLQAAGNEVRVAGSIDPYFGGASAVSLLGGGADPRRSGAVLML
jgi:gamma-glutamyltranspeptidase/glutathione hydrolase